jgi:predicted solute-binding protein
MKADDILDLLHKLFQDPEKIDMAELEKLLFDTLKFFDAVRTRLSSDDEKDRELAMKEAVQVQEKLNQLTERIYSKTGLTREKVQEILSNPANFKPQDWEAMKSIENELNQFRKSL